MPARSERRLRAERLRKVAGLDRFCVYEYSGPPVRKLPTPEKRSLLRLVRDRAAIVPLGDDLDGITMNPFDQHFRQEVGQVGVLPPAPTPAPSVRLSLVDTEPTGDGVPAQPSQSTHGYTLAHIADELVGGLSQPVAAIDTQLALSITGSPQSTAQGVTAPPGQGGYFGTVSDLSRAIYAEIDHWTQSATETHLILNLSLGWDGDLFGDYGKASVAELDPDAQSVFAALRYAAAQGVLAVAAAGNTPGGSPEAIHPLLPAGWETNAPSAADNLQVQGPIVYAAGGVQGNGWRLANSRSRSMPERAAYADHAVVIAAGSQTQVLAMTGTSVATVVVSSAAALVWQYQPTLDRNAVMQLVTGSGVPLGYPADVYATGTFPTVKKVMLCRALDQALQLSTSSCQPADPAFPLDFSNHLVQFNAVQAMLGVQFPGQETLPTSSLPMCPPGTLYFSTTAPSDVCPAQETRLLAALPWVYPQPGAADPCPSCSLTPDKPPAEGLALFASATNRTATTPDVLTLRVKIDGDPSLTFKAPTLLLVGRNGRQVSYAIPATNGVLKPGDSLAMTVPDTVGAVSASLSLLDANDATKAYLSPVFLAPQGFTQTSAPAGGAATSAGSGFQAAIPRKP